ncbi:hypothetical protein [Neisseria dentiae]
MCRMLLPFAVSIALALTACGAKDACLDEGGRYNETTKQCEK